MCCARSLCLFRILPAQGTDNNAIIEVLRESIKTLERRCNELERSIEDIQSRYNTHERLLDVYREEILVIKFGQGTLETDYQGEKFDLMESK